MAHTTATAEIEHGETAHAVPIRTLLLVLATLLVLTWATVAATWFDLGSMNLWLALGIATAKATLVLLYFMHLKFEGKWKIVLLAPTTILALAIIAALMPDIGTHYYDVRVPQTEYASGAAHDAGHGETGADH